MRESVLLRGSYMPVFNRPQYNDNVVGPGNNYDDAYFELKSVRAYTTGTPGATGVAALGAPRSGADKSVQLRWLSMSVVLAGMIAGMIIV